VVSVTAQPPARRRSVEVLLDLAEKLFLVGLFALMALRMYRAVGLGATWVNYLQLAAEGIAVVLILLRRPALEVSSKPIDWGLAFGATAAPLLVRAAPHTEPLLQAAIPALLMMFGLWLQISAKLSLGRAYGVAPANRGLAVKGLYRLVRHPIYLAYFLGQTGFLLLNPTLWNLVVLAVAWVLQILRIQAEERLLAHDPVHAAFRAKVRFRLVPGLW
jgi:protein-S-isoprenylcysteine O-methyltransferase Ste14